jgi:hypothetical protein
MGFNRAGLISKPRIVAWDDAFSYFKNTKLPRSIYWTDNKERPLGKSGDRDLRIRVDLAMCPDSDKQVETYTCILGNPDYDLVRVTYYPPLESGLRRVNVTYKYVTSATQNFVERFTPLKHERTPAIRGTGEQAENYTTTLPLVLAKECPLLGKDVTYTVMLKDRHKIITDMSWHVPLFHFSSNASNNAYRAELRAKWFPICNMAAIAAEPKIAEILKPTRSGNVTYTHGGKTYFSRTDLPSEHLLRAMEQDINDGRAVQDYEALVTCAAKYAVNKFMHDTWEPNFINSDENTSTEGVGKHIYTLLDRSNWRAPQLRDKALTLYQKNYGTLPYVAYENMEMSAEVVATALAREIVTKYYRHMQSKRVPVPMFPEYGTTRGNIKPA